MWMPIANAPADGTLIELRCNSVLGSYELLGAHFLHEDGEFYRVEPPTLIVVKPSAWRYYIPPQTTGEHNARN